MSIDLISAYLIIARLYLTLLTTRHTMRDKSNIALRSARRFGTLHKRPAFPLRRLAY
jgi:hypothetical protein